MNAQNLVLSGTRSRPGVAARPPRWRVRLTPYLLLGPAVIYLTVVTLPPFVYALQASFTNAKLAANSTKTFVGLANYRQILHDPGFRRIAINTVEYTVLSVALTFTIGLAIALILSRCRRGRGLYQSFLLLPMVSTPLVIGLVFRYMLNTNYGVITYILSLVDVHNISLLGDPSTALLCVVGVEVWQWTPFVALVLLSGLEAVPKETHEAAAMDGASAWQSLRHIILPQMQGVMVVVLLIRFMDAFRAFDLIYVLTNGGPGEATETITMDTWRQSFLFFNLGKGAAFSMIMLYVSVVGSWLFMLFIRRRHASATATAQTTLAGTS